MFPVTTVDKSIDQVDELYIPLNDEDKAVFESCKCDRMNSRTLADVDQKDDPDIFDGAHVSLQIVGRRLQEEKILAFTEMIGDALGKHTV